MSTTLKWWTVAGAVAGAMLLSACAGSKTESAGGAGSNTTVASVNTMCPIGGHDFQAGSRTAKTSRTWKGKTIGFCCADCVESFDTMAAAEKDAILALAVANKSQDE